MPKILSLKWKDEHGTMVCIGAKEIEVSQTSAELNLKVSKGAQYPKYVPVKDLLKYFDEKTTVSKSDEEVVAEEVKAPKVKAEKPATPAPAKEAKPIFKTVEEKENYEKAQKEAANSEGE